MTEEMFDLIKDNYTELIISYCKYQNKYKLNNANTCEDRFNDKVLKFMQLNIETPTIELLQKYLKSQRKDREIFKCLEYKDYFPATEDEIIIDKLKYLFIDYRPKK